MKDSATPTFSVSTEGNITITIPQTQALLADQGYTYNQAGLTYNQVGVMYGGIYNQNQDSIPSLFVAMLEHPLELSFTDIGIQGQTETSGQLIGILGLTYPTKGVLY